MPKLTKKHYSIDANSLIYAWHDVYSPEFIQPFWDRLDELGLQGRMRISEEIYEELRRKDDALFAWVKARRHMVVPLTDEIQAAVTEILKYHPLLVKARKNRSGGDPFVIALAMSENCCVVTQEGAGSERAPKIPDVCRAYRIPCKSLQNVIRDEGWQF